MTRLRLIASDEARTEPARNSSRRLQFSPPRWLWRVALAVALLLGCLEWWWEINEDKRELRALPDAQRLSLYHTTMQNLRTLCDPAPPRSMRDYCHQQANLALMFLECERDPACQELARRHVAQPRR